MSTAEPLFYTLKLAPDLDALTFEGEAAIEVAVLEAGSPVTFDADGLSVNACSVRQRDRDLRSSFTAGSKTITVSCPAVEPGNITVSFRFAGKLRSDLEGFYDAPYEQDGRVKHLAVTQFESESARRAFPCFDHPRYNTPFSIALEAPEGTVAIATSPVKRKVPRKGGGTVYAFETTPPMPTYLLFFGVGDFELVEDRDYKVPVRTAATPGKAVYGREAMEIAKASIDFCEAFTGLPYPVGKLDLIAVPAFAFGAMENLGAITFRENLLLYYPDTTSQTGLERNALITAHEVAHMWFGDLVSPRDWRYVWLNEAFATYLQYLIGEAVFPDRRIRERFLYEGFTSAFMRDSLMDTVPIESPEGGNVEVDTSTAPIFYQKAGLVLRMAHLWLGDERFSKGVRSYLSAFAFRSTDTGGFLDAFGRGAGREASDMIENWIRQPGFPVVKAKRDGNTLSLTQHRYTWLPNESGQLWHIPLSILLFDDRGGSETVSLELKEKTAAVALPAGAAAYKVNAGNIGFFHTEYDAENLERLGELYRGGRLAGEDRYGLVLDLAASVMRGELPVGAFTDYLRAYCMGEREYLPLAGIADALSWFWRRIPAQRKRIADTGKALFEPVYRLVGIVPQEGEEYRNVLLRDTVLWPLLLFGSEEVASPLAERFRRFSDGGAVEADLLRFVLVAGAASGSSGFEVFRKAIEDPAKTGDSKLHAYEAIGWFPGEETLSRVIAYTGESIGEQDRIYVYRALAANPAAERLLFRWLEENLRGLASAPPYLRSVAVADFSPMCEPGGESRLDTLIAGCNFSDPSLQSVIAMAKEKRKVFQALKNGR